MKYCRTYSLVYRVQPFLSGHVDLEHDVQVALRVWMLEHRHTFPFGNNGLSWFDDLSPRAAHVDAPSIEVCH